MSHSVPIGDATLGLAITITIAMAIPIALVKVKRDRLIEERCPFRSISTFAWPSLSLLFYCNNRYYSKSQYYVRAFFFLVELIFAAALPLFFFSLYFVRHK